MGFYDLHTRWDAAFAFAVRLSCGSFMCILRVYSELHIDWDVTFVVAAKEPKPVYLDRKSDVGYYSRIPPDGNSPSRVTNYLKCVRPRHRMSELCVNLYQSV